MFSRLLFTNPETIADLQAAAAQRYSEGEFLIRGGYPGAGIYLLGYSAEMLLNIAYFRVKGVTKPTFQIASGLGPAKTVGGALIPTIEIEGYHSIRFWAMLIQAVRRGQNRALSSSVELPFEVCTERLHSIWWVEMRYRDLQPISTDELKNDALAMLADVDWLRLHHVDLWS